MLVPPWDSQVKGFGPRHHTISGVWAMFNLRVRMLLYGKPVLFKSGRVERIESEFSFAVSSVVCTSTGRQYWWNLVEVRNGRFHGNANEQY